MNGMVLTNLEFTQHCCRLSVLNGHVTDGRNIRIRFDNLFYLGLTREVISSLIAWGGGTWGALRVREGDSPKCSLRITQQNAFASARKLVSQMAREWVPLMSSATSAGPVPQKPGIVNHNSSKRNLLIYFINTANEWNGLDQFEIDPVLLSTLRTEWTCDRRAKQMH